MKTIARSLLAVTVAAVAPLWVAAPVAAATPTCFGQTATIVGTPGDDVLVGSADRSDVIFGGGGNDYIAAEDFSVVPLGQPGDFLCGGAGNDTIRGSTGSDSMAGGYGDDRLDGWVNADVARGGGGDDWVTDCEGEDAFNDDADVLHGGYGDDHLCTQGSGADLLTGADGNDTLVDLSCAGSKDLRGGPGNDLFESFYDSFNGMSCAEQGDDDPDSLHGGQGWDSAQSSPSDVSTAMESVSIVS